MDQVLALEQKPPIGRAAFGVTDEAFRTTVEIDLDAHYQRLRAETLAAMKEFQQQGLTGKPLADAVAQRLRALSDAPIEAMGRQSTAEAFNLGRNIAAQERAAEIKEVVRTEILDAATCAACFLLDFSNSRETYVLNSREYFEFMPPRKCFGRTNCRGFYLFRSAA